MAVPRARVDVGPVFDQDARGVVVLILQGGEECTIFVVVLDIDVVAMSQQHQDTLRVAGRGCKVQWCVAEFTACHDDGGGGSGDGGDGDGAGEFAWVPVEKERGGTGKCVDGYVTLIGIA